MESLPQEIEDRQEYFTGGQIDEVSVALRFFGDDLDPGVVSGLLESEPTKAWRKGDVIGHKRSQRVAKTGAWILSGERNTEHPLEEEIRALFERLPKTSNIWERLGQYQGDLFCGLWLGTWNHGLELSSQIAKEIADRHLTLKLDIYCMDVSPRDFENAQLANGGLTSV